MLIRNYVDILFISANKGKSNYKDVIIKKYLIITKDPEHFLIFLTFHTIYLFFLELKKSYLFLYFLLLA